MDSSTKGSPRLGVVSALIIDDNAFDRRRLSRIARDSELDFFLREAASLSEVGALLDQDKYDVIYIDMHLDTGNGLDLLPIVRAHRKNADAGLIMISGAGDTEAALKAMKSGFADYVGKDELNAATFTRATINAVEKLRLARVAQSADAETKSIEGVLKSFAQACTDEMRPMLARMLRQVRQMKTVEGKDGPHAAQIAEIESTCDRMEEFFQDLGSLADDKKLGTVISLPAEEKAAPLAIKPGRPKGRPVPPGQPQKGGGRQRLFSSSP